MSAMPDVGDVMDADNSIDSFIPNLFLYFLIINVQCGFGLYTYIISIRVINLLFLCTLCYS